MKTPVSLVCFAAAICIIGQALLTGCSSEQPTTAQPITGTYHVQQEGASFGEGAEKITLDLNADKTFQVHEGPTEVTLEGTWVLQDGKLKFSEEKGALVMNYRVDGSQLIPMQAGEDIPGWRWVR
jgi:hypothetical protein